MATEKAIDAGKAEVGVASESNPPKTPGEKTLRRERESLLHASERREEALKSSQQSATPKGKSSASSKLASPSTSPSKSQSSGSPKERGEKNVSSSGAASDSGSKGLAQSPPLAEPLLPATRTLPSNPSPNAYRISSPFGTAPAASIKGRHVDRDLEKAKNEPAPIDYYVKINAIKQQAPSFSFTGRKIEKVEIMPGPGNYMPQKPLSNRSIPISFRFPHVEESWSLSESATLPGPGQYDRNKYLSFGGGPQYSFGGRPSSTIEANPGPADYSAFLKKSNAGPVIGFRFETPTVMKHLKDASSSPGPQNYNVAESEEKIKHNYGCYSFGHEELKGIEVAETSPGPFAYPTRPGGTSHAWSMGGRHPTIEERKREHEAANVPSPNSYNADPPPRVKAPAYSFGKRLGNKTEIKPGPGQYDIRTKNNNGQGASFGIRYADKMMIVFE